MPGYIYKQTDHSTSTGVGEIESYFARRPTVYESQFECNKACYKKCT